MITKDILWAEKYHPITIGDCILPERIKEQLINIVQGETHPNLLFSGPPGVGKTSAAKALVNGLNASCLLINRING